MKPGYTTPYCKDAYVGSTLKTPGNLCVACHKDKKHCTCAGKDGCGGICQAVVDDANGVVYLYGNVTHENYHVPGGNCIAYTGVTTAGTHPRGRVGADELWEGEQDGNNITLTHEPLRDNTLFVFLNGVKQVYGPEADYVIEGRKIHFNFYDLLPTDRVEVMYEYEV